MIAGGIGIAMSDVVLDALLVEEGQPRRITGQLQSVQWGSMSAASLLTGILGGSIALHGWLRPMFAGCGLLGLVSLGMVLVALIMVAIAENARIPVDNPATHLELTMVHEAMVLEYSGRHLAMIEFAGALKLLLYVSLIGCVFVPWGLAPPGSGVGAHLLGFLSYLGKLLVGGILLAGFETAIAKMRVFRVPAFLGAALMLGLLGTLLLFVSRSL